MSLPKYNNNEILQLRVKYNYSNKWTFQREENFTINKRLLYISLKKPMKTITYKNNIINNNTSPTYLAISLDNKNF